MAETRFETPANFVSGFINRGGHLTVSDTELRFEPNRVERLLRAEGFTVPCDRITDLSVTDTDISPRGLFSGGLRRRLAIDLADGRRLLFVVPDVDEAATEIDAVLSEAT